MGKKVEVRNLKGFRDFGPKEQMARQAMFMKIQEVFERFGFLPLSTPVLEYKEILMNKYGDDEKLVYSFKDMGDRDVAMRYDLTVPMARYVAQNRGQLVFPFKRYQIAPAWRADNTQRGRLREFYQCDVDTVGTTSLFADAEAIACIYEAYKTLGVTNVVFRINDRRLFNCFLELIEKDEEKLKEVVRSLDKVDKVGVDGVVHELQGKGFDESVWSMARKYLGIGKGAEGLDQVLDVLGGGVEDGYNSLRTIFELLRNLKVPDDVLLFDPTIARGQDYYTGTIFECFIKDEYGFGSIGSGGRYDGLVDQFTDDGLPAVGASIGIDRLFEWLEEKGVLGKDLGIDVLVLNFSEEFWLDYINLVTSLREQGLSTELYYEAVKLDKQFKYAESKGAKFAIIFGEEEKSRNVVKVKTLKTREQEEVGMENLAEYIKAHK